ncbi:MAG: signal peptidase I [bacterium]
MEQKPPARNISSLIGRFFKTIFNFLFAGPIFTIFLVLIILIRIFVAEPFLVYGSSMEPNFETGDYLIVDELTYKFESPKRGDVVVLKPPMDESKHYIKRIIGLPGETISVNGSAVVIKNKENPEGFTLNEPYITFQSDRVANYALNNHEYFVMGDNRAVSSDSRIWGPLPSNLITGRALLRILPLKDFGIMPGEVSLPR